jgi:hypothetical protein
LISVKDPSIRRWLSKSCNPNSSSHNDTKLQQLSDKHQKRPATPARKRSSLARPVRVQDNYVQGNESAIVVWKNDQNLQNQEAEQRAEEEQCLENKVRMTLDLCALLKEY